MSRAYEKICIICGLNFCTPVHNKKVCSTKCKNKYRVIWNRDHRPERSEKIGKCLICKKEIILKTHVTISCCSKECRDIANRKRLERYKIANKDKIKERYKRHRESEKRKKWEKDHEDELYKYRKVYNVVNKDKILKYKRDKYKNDISFKLGISIRGFIRRAITKKQLRSKEYIDYTIDQLRLHLESGFLPGMSWDNYGEWHIDHIRPLISFNFYNPDGTENIEEIKKAMALNNLQPLWAYDNISKGGRYCENMEELA